MTAPVIKTSTEEVTFSTEFSDFVPGADYRLGVGTAGPKLTVKLELLKNEVAVEKATFTFVQGFTSSWWDVERVSVQGFALSRAELPRKGEKLRLKVSLSREHANQHKKIYVLVARKYGASRWYIEDGVEMDDSLW